LPVLLLLLLLLLCTIRWNITSSSSVHLHGGCATCITNLLFLPPASWCSVRHWHCCHLCVADITLHPSGPFDLIF
jgi:hypothetical protein